MYPRDIKFAEEAGLAEKMEMSRFRDLYTLAINQVQ
jgi:hypothetical protein